jgi:DNA-binding SARP family transcriptional activator
MTHPAAGSYSSLLWPRGGAPSTGGEAAAERGVLVLGAFATVVGGRPVSLSGPARRVVAYLAVAGPGPLDRHVVAAALWPDRSERAARMMLRQALAYERRRQYGLIEASYETVGLQPSIFVDLHQAIAAARLLLASSDEEVDPSLFLDDLLPGWVDEWLPPQRDRFWQLRLRCLEELSRHWLARGRMGPAIAAAEAAVGADPLRESAHTLLIRAHLAEGNRGHALRQYRRYESALEQGLGLGPAPELQGLIGFGVGDGRLDRIASSS